MYKFITFIYLVDSIAITLCYNEKLTKTFSKQSINNKNNKKIRSKNKLSSL